MVPDAINKIVAYMKYTSEDSMYYEKKMRVDEDEFEVILNDESWKIVKTDEVWTYYYIPNVVRPVQGWKIHISAAIDEAESVLKSVSKVLVSHNIPFKHIKNNRVLKEMYSKNGNRISAGKFITIYPLEEEFIDLIFELENEIKKFKKGPYILTDKQWKNTNIFYRYGAFQRIVSSTGELCIYDPAGNLVPDMRLPQYYLPPFVKEPEKLVAANIYQEDSSDEENKLNDYNIESALRFSNSGGIYKGTRKKDGVQCIIKEARAAIGFDGANHSSKERLENEYNALCKLKNINGIVNAYDYFEVWDNTFLVEEYVEGVELVQWITLNYPFTASDNVETYIDQISSIMNDLKNIVYSMHKLGVAMCDLQTRNILVDNDLKITLIDFEIATDPESTEIAGMGTKGYCHKLNKKAAEKDWYALNRIMHFAMVPIGSVTDIDMELNSVHCSWIKKCYGKKIYDYYVCAGIIKL